jgi:hypothetical protein
MAIGRGSDIEYVGSTNSSGVCMGQSSAKKIGFYGTTPITQRAAAAQATSLVGTASSTAITSDVKAALIEVMSTLAALGLWKGSA